MVSPGHMIPLIDIAKLLSRRGVSTTIVTTDGNDPLARPAIDRANSDSSTTLALPIELILLPFPPSSTPPPHNRQNLTNIPLPDYTQLLLALATLLPSLRDLLSRRRPDFFVSDAVFTWTADLALDLGIPRIVFEGPGAFPLCVHESLSLISVDDETTPIVVGDLPDPIELARSELSNIFNYPEMIRAMKDAEAKSFGVVVNTFSGLEPAYAKLYSCRRAGRRAWFIGPVSQSSNEDDIARADRGGRSHPPDTARLMRWLDEQPVRSVVYVCFGSLCDFDAAQMRETAAGLEAAGHRFVWAVRDWEGMPPPEGWLPEGFEGRVEGRGMVVRGWVPQVAILSHAGVGAFVTHCGWNSTLEGVAAGLPMVAWPLMYEQFVNARLITDVLRVGVGVGKRPGETVMAGMLAAAVRKVMEEGGEEAEEFRRRAVKLGALAREAVGVGGSSYEDVGRMVEELRAESSIRFGKELMKDESLHR
ncbi:UDP-glucose flavonoid 3-O-glucosyltransferase 7 [Platanthera zijinensis]|uniref:Glycosyltransferase n=1 Tax=Platanthera zijinensis TaxID=2320716 RepID=A0AAP0FY00_9ASPA